VKCEVVEEIDLLEAVDIDTDFDRDECASVDCRKLFEGVFGCEYLIAQLERYQKIAKSMKRLGNDPRSLIPFSFLFRGPPGKLHPCSLAKRMSY
jgi:hypothetical protein